MGRTAFSLCGKKKELAKIDHWILGTLMQAP